VVNISNEYPNRVCSAKRLIDTVKDCKEDKQYCFVLGAGASVESGIPTGVQLAQQWLEELKAFEPEMTTKFIEDKGIDTNNSGEFYSQIYEQRFRTDLSQGYITLQKIMAKRNPSCGYYHLAKILTETTSNLVITTNFDNLVEDSIFIFTDKRPVIITHELLAKYTNMFRNKPIIAKIHRDLMFFPKNTSAECRALDLEWTNILKTIFEKYIPIFIGYGGNDGSLMNFLNDYASSKDKTLYWCHRDIELTKRIVETVNRFNGYFVKIDGFDELMFLFGDEFGHGRGDEPIKDIADFRIKSYKEQFDKISAKYSSSTSLSEVASVKEAIQSIQKNAPNKQWLIELEKKTEKGDGDAEDFSKKGGLLHYFSQFEEAAKAKEKAIELDSKKHEYLSSLATTYEALHRYDEAITCLTNAINLNNGEKAEYFSQRGRLYLIAGKEEESQQDLKKADELGAKIVSKET